MTDTKEVDFTQHSDYETACKLTDKGLIPLAIILQPLGNEFNFPPGFPIHSRTTRQTLLAMTTVFENFKDCNQWGWVLLDPSIKDQFVESLYESGQCNLWTYWSQSFKEQA